MISLGSLLWIVGIGALAYFMMRKGGGCCGGGSGHESHKNEMDDRSQIAQVQEGNVSSATRSAQQFQAQLLHYQSGYPDGQVMKGH